MKDIITLDIKTILVTGSPGFIGADLVLMDMAGGRLVSFDNITTTTTGIPHVSY